MASWWLVDIGVAGCGRLWWCSTAVQECLQLEGKPQLRKEEWQRAGGREGGAEDSQAGVEWWSPGICVRMYVMPCPLAVLTA
jgi:hypothetical protein